MVYSFMIQVKDRETKEIISVEKRVDPDEIACYYQNDRTHYISTKGGKLYKLSHSFADIKSVSDYELEYES